MASRIIQWSDGLYERYSRYSEGRKRWYVWALYTLIFLFGVALAFSVMAVKDRSVIWTYDSSGQYYPGMVYFAQAVKDFFSGLTHGQWIWPRYDFAIGFGEDVTSALHYYGFGDPLYLLAALAPRALMEQAFTALVFLRAYLSGLFLFLYLRHFGVRRGGALLGAVAYALSGYVTAMIVGHQIFLNAVMYLPLILLGFERLMDGVRPVLLPVATALCALTGYYMFYMVSVFLFMYAIYRFFKVFPRGKGRGRPFLRLFLTSAGYYALGVFIAGVMLLPAVWGFLHRVVLDQGMNQNPLFYSLKTYLSDLPSLIFLSGDDSKAVAILSLAAMLLAVTNPGARKRHSGWVLAACVLACLIVPFFGYMFNGFSYVTDRWTFMLTFLGACALGVLYPELMGMKRGAWIALLTVSAVLLAGFTASLYLERGLGLLPLLFVGYAGAALVLTLWALRLAQRASLNLSLPAGARKMLPLVICAVAVAVNLGANGLVQNIAGIRDGHYIRAGAVDRLIDSSPAAAVDAPKGTDFYRVEVPLIEWTDRNDGMALGVNGTACYLSVVNENPINAVTDMESVSRTLLNQVLGLDQREALMALTNVRYYAKQTDSPQQAPYGFTLLKKTDKAEVYENQNALPIGYSTTYVISGADYRKMTGLERQQALLKGAVLQDATESTYTPAGNIASVGYQVADEGGAKWVDGVLEGRKGKSVALRFDAPAGAETYLRFSGVNVTGLRNGYGVLEISGDGFEKLLVLNDENFRHGRGSDTFLVNLGYHEAALTEAKISFDQDTRIKLQGLEVLAVPMADFAASVSALRAQSMTDASVVNGRVEGDVDFTEERVLVFGIPYSGGWTAMVDGAATPLDPSTGLTMAIRLPSGRHHVVLTYENPWQKAGAYLSLIALAAMALLWAFGIRFTAGARGAKPAKVS